MSTMGRSGEKRQWPTPLTQIRDTNKKPGIEQKTETKKEVLKSQSEAEALLKCTNLRSLCESI